MSRKSERLVNLTIALLATKRYLTKSEIFRTVAGYSGDAEAKDRMFERDKDDLRSLGITIELGTFDPLFEDEAGYRIKRENYSLQLRNLNPLSIALLSRAGAMWREAALGETARSGLRKLKSLGLDSDQQILNDIAPISHSAPEQLSEIIEAISSHRRISFEYLDDEMVSQLRTLEPYRLSNSRGYWYLIGRDLDRQALRTFRVDRFSSAVNFISTENAFEVDISALDSQEESDSELLSMASVKARKGCAVSLRGNANIEEIDSDWDLLSVAFTNEALFLRQILLAGQDVVIIEPESLREKFISILQQSVALHG